jgi:DNA-binding SARP family transcriptional activator/tetratricopeptide (TPR) repeat protein
LEEVLAVAAQDRPEAPSTRNLVLSVLGSFTAECDGRRLPLTTRKTKALLAYLALSDNAHDTRERIVGLLWSENEEERARASLRQAIHEIKSACSAVRFQGFSAEKQTLALAPDILTIDVDEILAAVADGRVHQRLLETQRIADTLLEDIDNVDQAFHVWVQAKRQLLHDRLTLALERLLPPEQQARDASPVALALLNLDPTHEIACRHLIRARAARGDVGGAMKIYKTLWDLLENDYDIEPSPETQDLIVGIKQQSGHDPAADTISASQLERSGFVPIPAAAKRLFISVCAFDLSGLAEDKRYVANGFQHELVACLARFREWSVRTLTPPVEPQPRTWSSPPEYLVEGSAYESAGAIRLVITFRDAVTSVCIWSERYTITLPEWFDIQQHIVRRIATALNVHVSAERLRRASSDADIALEIHDRWLRGQELMHRVTPADMRAAAAIFSELTRDAPQFSPALSGMVQINNMEHIVYPGRFRDRARHLATLRLAQNAVQLDPLDSRAHLGLAWSHQLVGRTHDSTLHASLAAELNENDAWTLVSCAQIFAYCGEYDRAQTLAAASLDLSPATTRSQMTYLSAIKFLCGAYGECVEAALHGLDASPGFSIWKCAALAHLERVEEAREEIDRALARTAADWQGRDKPSPTDMLRWLLHMFPIAVEKDWQRLRDGFAAAGAPVESIGFYRR